MSADWRSENSLASTRAPAANSAATASKFPVRAQVMSTFSPDATTAFASAPAASRAFTITAFAFVQASESGVTP